ncbi:MAG: GC-type dockerin domain-anchored protein [Phycisphaerales bacterium]
MGDGLAVSFCPGGDPFGCQAGAVYAFEREGSRWIQTQTIIPPDIGFLDGFGAAVALDPLNPNRFLTVTALKMGQGELGYGHIYEYDGELWVETARIPRPDGEPVGRSGFGRAAALYGDTALVSQAGLVYRFREVGGQWAHEQTIERPPEVSELSYYANESVLMLGDWVFIGAYRDSSTGSPHGSPLHGSVIVYHRNPDGSLEYVQRMLPPEQPPLTEQSVNFGYGLAFDGTTLAVGARGVERAFRSQGAVYIYELDGDIWTLRQEILSSMPAFRAGFGQSISVYGDHLITGHGRLDDYRAFAFQRGADGAWRETAVLRPGDGASSGPHDFGSTTALHGPWAIVGAHNEEPGGAAYAYNLACFDCPADLDADGDLTIFDFLSFANFFQDGDAQADFDGDGELTIFDFLAYQTAFDAGC